jgi:dTDP-4-amino-4,6-dideoxygalactose transaminase
MRARLVDLERLHAPIRREIDQAIARVVDSGRFVLGPEVDALEREIAQACGVPFAVAVSSGSDAILGALWAAGIGPGAEVLTSAFSFAAAAEAIVRVGATPVFVDVDLDLNMDADAALARFGERTSAILTVDLFGRRAVLPRVDVPIFEDAAQAIGATGVGLGVRAAAISFFPTKNLGALGDGGMVLTVDAELAETLRVLRVHGSRSKYVHERIGWNMRLDALQAAVLRVKLPHLAGWNVRRKRIATTYRSELSGILALTLPRDAPDHVWHQFVVRVARGRDELRAHLAEHGIETEVYYPQALHLQPCFAFLGGRPGDLPRAEAAAREVLALPIHAALTEDELAHVVGCVRSFLR